MKIAAAAYPLDWHNRWNEYVGKIRLWVRTAAEQGAEVLLFPENAALELASLADEENARDPRRAVDAVTARIKDVDELHASLAREFKVHICAATAPIRSSEGGAVGRARFFAPDGSSLCQEKQLPTRSERETLEMRPGGPLRVFETSLGRFGILIGSDAAFPTLARTLASGGAEVLLVPGRSDGPRGFGWLRTAAMARALETGCVVAQAATVGDGAWLPGGGRSHGAAAIYAPPAPDQPEDGTIAAGKLNTAGWVYGEASLESVAAARDEGGAGVFTRWPEAPAAAETVRLGIPE